MMQNPRSEAVEQALLGLFRDEPDNSAVLGAMYAYYSGRNRLEDFISRLEEQRKRDPSNRQVADLLVTLYGESKRTADALRVLDELRQAVAGDADQLYMAAHLYERVERPEMTEQLLQEVLKLDSQHGPASNDLGYMWADAGRNLDQAESLIRIAVDVEPDNSAYLDSLGWVLYKRGKFDEAKRYLKAATEAVDDPDAVVLDHYADVLYRLDQQEQAVKIWTDVLEQIKGVRAGREDLKKLQLHLQQKLRQQKEGVPVSVAPAITTGSATSATRPAAQIAR